MMIFVFAGSTTAADNYPSKTLTIIVTFGPGGLSDISARLEAERLEKELGQPIKVICKPGGGTIPGVMSFLKEPPDGHTLLRMAAPSAVTNPLIRKTPFNPLKDFMPLFLDVTNSNVLYVRADSPYKDVKDFVEAAKKKTMLIGINQIGAPPHLSAAQFADEMGLEFKMITYKQIPASIVGMLGGHVDAAIGQLLQNKQYEGKIRPLVIMDKRLEYQEQYLPGVPTVSEVFPGKKAGCWINGGLAVKTGTPQPIIDRLVAAAEKRLNTQEFKAAIEASNQVYRWVGGPETVMQSIKDGQDLYRPIIEKLGIKK
jgi:tripartite-type tricarboxylate transporter receptor subunit TctC